MSGRDALGAKVKIALAIGAVVYLAVAGYMYAFQRDFVFRPSGFLTLPADKGLSGVQVVRLDGVDGVSLTGWFAEARDGKPSLLYFHGNAGNMAERSERFRKILNSGYGLLAISYRGYPGSSGSPSEAGFISDGVAAFDWLNERTGRIVIYGESIGSAVAIAVAAERDGVALILEAPFTAAIDLAGAQYPWLPVSLLMKDRFASRERIGRVSEPLLIVHGSADQVVPVAHGHDLYQRHGGPKRIHIVEGGGHGGLWDRGLWPAVDAFLAEPLQ